MPLGMYTWIFGEAIVSDALKYLHHVPSVRSQLENPSVYPIFARQRYRFSASLVPLGLERLDCRLK